MHGELLRRHAPLLRFDSGERWFATDPNTTPADSSPDCLFGHAAPGRDGRWWLQYWCFYRWNDPRLLGPWLPVGVHEGDWEMIQLRLDAAEEVPELAMYAQHSHVVARDWQDVVRDGERPVVWVGRGSHASYFSPGQKWTGVWLERANGRGRAVAPEMVEIVDGDPRFDWVSRSGRWGATEPRGGLLGRLGLRAASPAGPGRQRQWRDPSVLLRELR